MAEEISPEQRSWRYRIFVLTWLVYAGFYLCRKNMSVVMPLLMEDLGYTEVQLGWTIFGYSFIYMLGQFANGMLSDRFGPRLILGIGLLMSVATNLVMGVAASSLVLFGLLHMANGYGQSTGWSGTVKNMSSWFARKERGVVMAWWATCYSIGGVIATAFATYVANNETFLPELGWRRGFFAPAALLLAIALFYIIFTRNKPSDAGFEDYVDDTPIDTEPEEVVREEDTLSVWKAVLSSPPLWVTGAMYFFLKLTRYAFLYWLPLYLVKALDYKVGGAGYTSTAYEIAGFCGVVAAGYISDKLMQSRRFPVACIMLSLLAGSFLLYPFLGKEGLLFNIIGIGLIGFMTYGPDALMTGAGAMDIGSEKAAGMASGFINGMGSIGQMLSPLIVAYVATSWFGWNGLFVLFAGAAVIGAALMALMWNHGVLKKNTENDANG